MKLWTSQTIEFYNELIRNGIAYCTKISPIAQDCTIAYQWTAEQMKKRIGEPPMSEIMLPVWAWYQYNSQKKTGLPFLTVPRPNLTIKK